MKHLVASSVLAALTLLPFHVEGETLYAPQTCAQDRLSLTVQNSSYEPQSFWIILRREPGSPEEQKYEVPAKKRQALKALDISPSREHFSIRTESKNLSFSLFCDGVSTNMTAVTSPRVEYLLGWSDRELTLAWQNLSRGPQTARIRYFAKNQQLLGEVSSESSQYFSSQSLTLTLPKGAHSLVIESEGRMSTSLHNSRSKRNLTATYLEPKKISADAQQVYFLAEDDSGSESFSFGLSNPNLIAKARDGIKNKNPLIVMGQIVVNSKPGANRNFASQDRSPWSWSVETIDDFAEVAHITCDGSPSLVEEYLPQWFELTQGQICFWNFHLKEELPLSAIETGIRPASSPKRLAQPTPRPSLSND